MGDHRLLDLLRRVPPARRTARGSARTPAPVHGGARPVHRQLAARWACLVGRLPDRVPVLAGSRRRDDVARCTVDPDHDLRGRSRAQSRARDLGRRGGQRRRRGRAARRRLDQRVQLAVDLLRQRARRCRRDRGQPLASAREPRRLARSLLRLRRCGDDHRRADAARLRDDSRHSTRVGHTRDHRSLDGLRGSDRLVLPDRVAHEGTAAAATHLPATDARGIEPERPDRDRAPSSHSSSCSRCTCSRSSTTQRSRPGSPTSR